MVDLTIRHFMPAFVIKYFIFSLFAALFVFEFVFGLAIRIRKLTEIKLIKVKLIFSLPSIQDFHLVFYKLNTSFMALECLILQN